VSQDRYELIKEVCEKRKREQADDEEIEIIHQQEYDPFWEMKEAGHNYRDFK